MEVLEKNLKLYLRDLLSGFSYLDFAPPIDKNKLQEKFKQLISQESPYWKYSEDPRISHLGWICIWLRLFDENVSVSIKILIQNEAISVKVFEGYGERPNLCFEDKIDMKSIWLDHKHFTDKFYDIVARSIEFGHGSKSIFLASIEK